MSCLSRLSSNRVLQEKIGYLLKRPVGRPPHEVRRYYASFGYQAQSRTKPHRVVAKVGWHPGELYPRVGFIVTNLARPAEPVVAFYNQRGTAEQWIKEGKGDGQAKQGWIGHSATARSIPIPGRSILGSEPWPSSLELKTGIP